MQILAQADLSRSHTFSISQTCSYLVEVTTIEEIKHVYQKREWSKLPKLILGKGSNVLFTQPFQGIVVVNNLLGKSVNETDAHWLLHIAGGEDWPELVKWSVEQGYYGLENLALIPGCAGSAPIQNIGAYGVELKDICEYVDILCLETFNTKRMSSEECQFGYRDSIFKNDLYQKVMIVAIGLKLPKQWSANIEYGPLQSLQSEVISAQQIYERVCNIRMEKLPDPNKIGNAGSFFKNPIISNQLFEDLRKQFPDLAAYPTEDGVKVAAGWLIEQCQLKGHQIGGAQVHPKQALVLINKDNATANDVIKLAATVRQKVLEKYQIALEHEVRFIGSHTETNLETLIESQ
ncbi:UDP-N-acetylmuramate dehydrogenase [Vibrio caribbeanicus]|uniref:UDP-N-acetylenolpyruvoylglucosamine reductase n=1 Tax=Vibrio caribbeanicus ATCC BAA-2122 TaxID=796620 RepID=E3BJ73_9VIBR|nr:UDP-N-acetylmuramate dehydrogenase [Vibrio caribbeanicus]EFP96999.1 UDP-N-acetylenolpyruvoylglucosamine reductase [Vibrio caribbeanicus ATCC BAA-2122]